MIAGSLARRYARALLDIGAAKNTYEQLGKEIDDLAATYSGSRDLTEALTNPVFTQLRRRAVLEAVLERLGASPITKNFALLLLHRERVPSPPAIARELRTMVDERAGRIQASVTSARPLLPEHVANVQTALEKASGMKVLLDKKEDPALLGGVVAKIGDVVYDGSVRTQLEQMRERFLAQ
jgi:F-type H+-transporting ATPase subunit delta